jgi:hypothetical protein
MVSGSLSQLWTFSQKHPPPPPQMDVFFFTEKVSAWCTVIRVSYRASAQFGTWTVVGVNGTLAEAKMFTFTLECIRILSSTSVPFRPMTEQMPNSALTHTKRFTGQASAKFGTRTVMGLNGTLAEAKMFAFILPYPTSSTSVSFRPTTEQMPILALVETKRITVYA